MKQKDALPLVLLVDDEEDMLELLESLLKVQYKTVKTANGVEALKMLSTEPFQLVISDVMMPGMDGFELCKAIKSNLEYSHIPVILLTAKNTMQAKVQGLELFADAYIEKPFSNKYLLVQIQNLLTNRSIIKQYFSHSPLVHLRNAGYSRAEEMFLDKLNQIIIDHKNDFGFDVDQLARLMTMSRASLFRKIKALSDITPNELIKVTRLKTAAELLISGMYSIIEISEQVGYTTPSNFSRDFFKQFGMTPSSFIKASKK